MAIAAVSLHSSMMLSSYESTTCLSMIIMASISAQIGHLMMTLYLVQHIIHALTNDSPHSPLKRRNYVVDYSGGVEGGQSGQFKII